MNKFRFASIAMLVFVMIFSSIIIAQNDNASNVNNNADQQECMKMCESKAAGSCDQPCNPSECTPEKMEQCQKQCDMNQMDCANMKDKGCDKASKDCSQKMKNCTK